MRESFVPDSFRTTAIILVTIIAIPLTIGVGSLIGQTAAPGTQRYFYGDGLGVNCTLEFHPDGTFEFQWVGCLGQYGKNHGSYSTSGGRLTLSPIEPNRPGFGGMDTEFYMVPWGERSYLIPTAAIVDFCNSVNAGTEPRDERHGRHYLREGDHTKTVTGLPSVPPAWDQYLLRTPVTAHVIAVDDKDATCVLDAGTDRGLRHGMTLLSPDSGEFLMLEIAEADRATSRARARYDGGLPHAGERFVTNWYACAKSPHDDSPAAIRPK